MLNGSAKISSDNSSFLEKALPSIFVQDQRPITERQGKAVIAGLSLFCQGMFVVQWHNIISILLKSFKFYWLMKKKKNMHRIHFPFLGFFFPHSQNDCSMPAPHSPERQLCPTVPFLPSILSRLTWALLFQRFPHFSALREIGSGSASSPGEIPAGSVAVQGHKDRLVDTLCTVTCRRARMNACLPQVKPITGYVSGMARTKWGILITADYCSAL